MRGVKGTVTDRAFVEKLEAGVPVDEAKCELYSCANPPKPGPSHNGSRYCQSGSIASGGHRSHCTCDSCF